MIVFINLFVILCVTFANEEDSNDEEEDWKRFYGNSWSSSEENNEPDSILAYVTRLDSNLQPMSAPYLSNLYNIYNPTPDNVYFDDDSQEYITKDYFSRKNADAKDNVEELEENRGKGESQENVESLETSDEQESYERLKPYVFEEEVILHCDSLTCPSQTHNCKSTFNVLSKDFNEIEVITQCLSITNEVLAERTTVSKNLVNDRYYFEIEEIDDGTDRDENIADATKISLAANLKNLTKSIEQESSEEYDQYDINIDSELLSQSSEDSFENIDWDNFNATMNLSSESLEYIDNSNETLEFINTSKESDENNYTDFNLS